MITGSVLAGTYFLFPNVSQNSIGIAFSDAVIMDTGEWDSKWTTFRVSTEDIKSKTLREAFEKKKAGDEEKSKLLFKQGCKEIYASIYTEKKSDEYRDFRNYCSLNVLDRKLLNKDMVSKKEELNWKVFKEAKHSILELEVIKSQKNEDIAKDDLFKWCRKMSKKIHEKIKTSHFNRYCLK
ncbi:hypothetical protein A6V39_01230 [Candidatus Mycoplasma haematobovis]|uniref:Uncharacterized protein n=1 Tax=Candidatus Mycoplasma haematobovis TaxID=432608 RepID=A0A1A9QFF4_9MOLU|nr:hypothetical protein [Candidatus Mycoplasma haematobovis]OAL10676.1 hypothetical protein A6V39_01230 [Candidatus Mycoplasma haematobovis]